MLDFLDVGLQFDMDAADPAEGYNVKPTQPVRILICEEDSFQMTTARWWFVPHWHKGGMKDWKATTFNAQIETASEKPTFRDAWKNGRCAIPAMGYYEWTGPKGSKQPHYISLETNFPIFFFAGLTSVTREGMRTCTILTRPASEQLSHLHKRMPVILAMDEVGPWLRGDIGTMEARDVLGTRWDGQYTTHRVKPFGHADDEASMIVPYSPH